MRKILILCFILTLSCKPSLVESINKTYDNEFIEDGFSVDFADCIRESRKTLINFLLEKNLAKNQRAYIIEIYGSELKNLQAKIITDRFNYDYLRDSGEKCNEVRRWFPGENYDHNYFNYLVQMAKENKFSLLEGLHEKHPISNTGLVYLTVVDFKENINSYELIKTIKFEEFRIN